LTLLFNMPTGKSIDWQLYDNMINIHLPHMTISDFQARYLPSISAKAIGSRAKKLGVRPKKYVPTDIHKTKISKSASKAWTDKEDDILLSSAHIQSIAELAIRLQTTKSAVHRRLKHLGFEQKEADIAHKHSRRTIESFTLERRQMLSTLSKGRKLTDEHKAKLAEARRRQSGRISSIQQSFYDIADSMHIEYRKESEPECKIGPWTFDAFVSPNILVEIQGEWIHSQHKNIVKDAAKATYIAKYFPQYRLEYIWEAEFGSPNRIKDRINKMIGIIQTEQIDFSFVDVRTGLGNLEESRRFINAYHYLGNLKGSITFSAYLYDEMIATAIYGAPSRPLNGDYGSYPSCLELRRLVIKEGYNKKNFASWFLTRSVALVPPKTKKLVSYADPVFGHNGTVYKSSGWDFDGITEPSYYYISNDGYVMHKKTLFERANSVHMKEADYAQKHGWTKVPTPPKNRFVKNLCKSR